MADAKSGLRRLLNPVLARLDARAAHQARRILDERQNAAEPGTETVPVGRTELDELLAAATARNVFVPPIERLQVSADQPFMQFSTCSMADFQHPRFTELCNRIGHDVRLHRKLWEFVFVVHHLERLGVLTVGSRGVGFGVGQEPLPAVFASTGCEIMATDAPADIGITTGWKETSQWAYTIDDLRNDGLCPPDEFARLVSYQPADMNNIDAGLDGYDFTWSACCFEHLGSIRHGLDFVINSVEQCLRPGGVAVHTTELNMSSNTTTLESPSLSIFRRSDLQELIDELRGRGHEVDALTIAPDAHHLDHHVDLPPYQLQPHLKLELAGYVSTSVGLVIRRGS